jgi:hypothetical protein
MSLGVGKMDKNISHWVIQVNRGVFAAYGPYRTYDAALNRYNKTFGGEINLFQCSYDDPEEAIREFKNTKYNL